MPGIPLICGLNPDTLEPNVNYTTRWIVPGGEIITSSRGRFVLAESRAALTSNIVPGTILVVTALSYQDAGTYTCEGRSTAPGASPLWASASFELQLNCKFKLPRSFCSYNNAPNILNNVVELLSTVSTVNATMSDSTVELECVMRAYI